MKMRSNLYVLATAIGAQIGMSQPARAIAMPDLQLAASTLGSSTSFPSPLPARFPTSTPSPGTKRFLHFVQRHGNDCGRVIRPAVGETQNAPVRGRISDLLGTKVSKLELIRLQQKGEISLQDTSQDDLAQSDEYQSPSDPIFTHGPASDCFNFPAFPPEVTKIAPTVQSISPNSSDFLASRRLLVSRTRFDTAWNRVSREKLSKSTSEAFKNFNDGRVTSAILAEVNSWTNQHIRYVEDSDLYGKSDYWATASMTLKRRAGDCEDIAIAKMQLLAAMGLARSDMYLTIVRDLVRNADHAVLVVRLEGKHFLLDNSTNRLLDASVANDYLPIFSFTNGQKWLHGTAAIASGSHTNQTTQPARISLMDTAMSEASPIIQQAANY